jgi:hypothetical protein
MALLALKEDEQMELAEFHAEHPNRLVKRFLESVKKAGARPATDEHFYESTRKDPSDGDPVPPGEVKSTFDFATQVVAAGGVEVEGAPELCSAYVDREIFLARTKLTENYWTPRTLDLLLVSAEGRPIVGELKIRSDSLPYFALIQALMHAAELTSEAQRTRLADLYPDKGFRFGEKGPWVDVDLIAYKVPDDTSRKRSLELAKEIASKLMADERVAKLIGRIAFLEARPDGERLAFSCDPASTFP